MERIWWAFLLPPLLFGLVIGFKLFTASSDRVVEGDPGRPFYLATEHNMDGFVIRTGEPSDDVPPAVQAAACRSYGDWLDQIATSPDVVIVDDPGLLRSAQLLAGDVYRGEDVTAEVERLLIDEDGDPARALDRLAEDDWSHQARETAAAYLDDREMDPSPGVEDRYVTYMVQPTSPASCSSDSRSTPTQRRSPAPPTASAP